MPHNAAIRQRILKAAMRRFSERGFHGTEILDVARAARTTEAVITDLYGSKGDLMVAVLRAAGADRVARASTMSDTLAAVRSGKNFERSIRELMDTIYLGADRTFIRLRTFAMLERPDLMGDVWEGGSRLYYDAICQGIRAGRAQGLVRKDVHCETAAAALMFTFAFRRLFENLDGNMPGLNLSRRDMRYFVDIWLRGVMEPSQGEKSTVSTVLPG